jgi:hypothetical protein
MKFSMVLSVQTLLVVSNLLAFGMIDFEFPLLARGHDKLAHNRFRHASSLTAA